MAIPIIKYYLAKNPEFGKSKGEFIAPTKEDYEKYFESMNGIAPGKAIRTYESYVRRHKREHEMETAPYDMCKTVIMEGDTDAIKEIESQDNFVRWHEPSPTKIETLPLV